MVINVKQFLFYSVQFCLITQLLLSSNFPVQSSSPNQIKFEFNQSKSLNTFLVVQKAKAFADTLSKNQLRSLNVEYSFKNTSNWSNLPEWAMSSSRVGLNTETLTERQWTALFDLLRSASGSGYGEGFDEIHQILNGDDYIGQHSKNRREGYGRLNYHVAFLGKPALEGKWQLQFGGHHIALTYTYINGFLAGVTPSFRGVDPFESFEQNGIKNHPLQQEHMAAVSLLSSLNKSQLSAARLLTVPNDITLGPDKDWLFPKFPVGLSASTLSQDQVNLLVKFLETYVGDVDDENSTIILEKYKKELPLTYISFAGSKEMNNAGDYIRIDGPSVWIELIMDTPFSFPKPHPHTVWRDKATDYGSLRP